MDKVRKPSNSEDLKCLLTIIAPNTIKVTTGVKNLTGYGSSIIRNIAAVQ
jgi:hypothetical protein